MRQSIYLVLATALIKADINNELRKQQKKLRTQKVDVQYLSEYMMRDIGLQIETFIAVENFSATLKAYRTVRYFRYLKYSKINM